MALLPGSSIQLLDDATATNGAPTAATDGVELPRQWGDVFAWIRSTAGSGTMTVTLKLWVYKTGDADMVGWYPYGTHETDADKGKLNEGNAIGETSANTIAHVERIAGLASADRVYLEVVAIGGTATAISAWLALPRGGGR